MPALDNHKHERYAQELARGLNQTAAYKAAGYIGDETAASRLSRNDKVQARVAELLERSAIKVEFTLADAARQLDEDRALAHSVGQAGAAVSASLGKAKLFGHVIEKAQVDHSGEITHRSAAVSAVDALIEGALAGRAGRTNPDALPN